MADIAFQNDIRDTNTYTENIHGEDSKTVYQIVNDLDAEVTVNFHGTHRDDTNFSDTVQLGTATVSAGATARDSLNEPWERIQVEVVATSSPTSGTCTVYQHE